MIFRARRGTCRHSRHGHDRCGIPAPAQQRLHGAVVIGPPCSSCTGPCHAQSASTTGRRSSGRIRQIRSGRRGKPAPSRRPCDLDDGPEIDARSLRGCGSTFLRDRLTTRTQARRIRDLPGLRAITPQPHEQGDETRAGRLDERDLDERVRRHASARLWTDESGRFRLERSFAPAKWRRAQDLDATSRPVESGHVGGEPRTRGIPIEQGQPPGRKNVVVAAAWASAGHGGSLHQPMSAEVVLRLWRRHPEHSWKT